MATNEELADAISLLVDSGNQVADGLFVYIKRIGIGEAQRGSIVDNVGRDFVGGAAGLHGLNEAIKANPETAIVVCLPVERWRR